MLAFQLAAKVGLALRSLLVPLLLEASPEAVLSKHPLIDLHVDLPIVLRILYSDNLSKVNYSGTLPGAVDLDRLRRGKSAGFFSIAFVECKSDGGDGFLSPTDSVRDTLEQIDLTRRLPDYFAQDVALATTPASVRANFASDKISHLIGIEGAHSLGNSLASLRLYHELGVRYLTLTHTCHNAFADSAGSTTNETSAPLHGGLSAYGLRLIDEMNRLGMIVDLSHTSDDTARQALARSEAPVIFSHSGARSIYNHIRNVPDDILTSISEGKGQHEAVVGIPFLPDFVGSAPDQTVARVADHVEHVAALAGRSRVAIGSDFDGFLPPGIEGLDDVSKYRSLFAELAKRGWSENELAGLASGNFLRVFQKVLDVSERLQKKEKRLPDMKPWSNRTDLGKTPRASTFNVEV